MEHDKCKCVFILNKNNTPHTILLSYLKYCIYSLMQINRTGPSPHDCLMNSHNGFDVGNFR